MKLPPPGSFRDRLLEEMSYRSRMQRFVEMTLLVGVISRGLHVKGEDITPLLKLFEDVLNHRAYLPGVLDQLSVSQKSWTRDAEVEALQEVARWTEDR